MIFLNLLFNVVLWHEDFVNDNLSVQQLYEYTVDIRMEEGNLQLRGNPGAEGFSCAWFYLDDSIQLTEDDLIEMRIKVTGVETRLKYLYKKKGSPIYWGQEIIVYTDTDWQKIRIPLKQARPFYSSNFPFALTPDKTPTLYFFIDNFTPGNFDTKIDYISIIKPNTIKEE
ncbi:MAG: hypothetical protein ABIL46_07490 [candidate division WOR-3 bacterium]